MTTTEQRVENRVPIALRIKLRYRKVDTFVSKFATNISANGMFISSRKPKDKGTLLRFELRLADDSTVISGQGKVAWVRPFDPKHPKRPHGMGIEFTTLSQKSRDLINQIVTLRLEQGLGEGDEIPFAAKRRPTTAASADVPVPTPVPAPARASQTAPAAPSSLPLPGDFENMQVDIGAAVARARALVGSVELGEELEKLYRVSAAPVAETVDEASNNLARMLGGTAVQAKRTRHVDPPTGVEIAAVPQSLDDEDDSLIAPPMAAIEQEEAAAYEAEQEPLAAEQEAEQEPLAAEQGGPLHPRAETQAVAEDDIVEAEPEAQDIGNTEVHYARAETDFSPEVIDEFNDADAPPTLVADSSEALRQVAAIPVDAVLDELDELEELEELPVIESANHSPTGPSAEAPMHLDDGIEESLDIDIDEETPHPDRVDTAGPDMSAAAAIDLGVIDAAALGNQEGDDFSESANNTMDLTDLIELPPNMDEADEIDIDLD